VLFSFRCRFKKSIKMTFNNNLRQCQIISIFLSPKKAEKKLHFLPVIPGTVSLETNTLDAVVQFIYLLRILLLVVLGFIIVMNLVRRFSGQSNAKKPGRRAGGNYGQI